jgi:hypothetical protein
MYKNDDRTYYTSFTHYRWVRQIKTKKRGRKVEKIIVVAPKKSYVTNETNVTVVEEYGCTIHVLFSSSSCWQTMG